MGKLFLAKIHSFKSFRFIRAASGPMLDPFLAKISMQNPFLSDFLKQR